MRLHGITLSALAAVCVFGMTSAPGPCEADTVTLKNGREIYGRLVEEKEGSIRIRTSGGTITISKTEVATFSENESLEPPKKRMTAREEEAEKSAAAERARIEAERAKRAPKDEDGDKDDGDKDDGDKDDGGDGDDGAKKWEWNPDVSDERIDELTPLRDERLEQLKEIGPTKEQRLKKLALSKTELNDLKERIKTIGARTNRRRRGNLMREKALNGIIDTYGLRAYERLTTSLGSKNLWTKRMAARGLASLAGKGDEGEAEWLFWNYDASAGLLALMDHQGEFDSPNIREDGFKALSKYVKKNINFKASDSAISTPAESQALKRAKKVVASKQKWWKQKQEENAKRREEIEGELDMLMKGEDPTGGDDGGDDDDDDDLE